MPPYSLKGTVERNCTLIVIDDATWEVEMTQDVVAGVPFNFEVPTSGTKTVIGRMFNGCSIGYGRVTPSEPQTVTAAISSTSYDGFMYGGSGWPSTGGVYYSYNGQLPWSAVTMGRQNNAKCEPIVFFTLSSSIPSGATIAEATMEAKQVDVWNSSGGTLHHKIRAELSATPSMKYNATQANAMSLTTAAVDWDATAGGWGSTHTTPDFKTVVQELVDTYGEISTILVAVVDDGSTGQYNRLGFDSPGLYGGPFCELTIRYS